MASESRTEEHEELKHLQFVVEGACIASELASSAANKSYEIAKSYAPELTEKIEKQSAPLIANATPVLAPIATNIVDASLASIKRADVKVGVGMGVSP